MANVVFIEPRCSFNSYGFFRLPLMGSLCLGTILKQAEHEVLVFRDSVKSVYNKAKDKLNENILKADVVAISVMTSTANRAYQIADAIRRASPRIRIIMGGAHATYMPEEALQHSDLVVKGEGEEVIIEAVENHKLTGIIDGPSVDDLNKYPIPDFSILADMDKPPRVTPISTSRGCPYDCIFCTVSSTFGRKYRFRDPDLVLEEIRMRVADGFRTFFFYDDNFAANRPGTKKILEGMADLSVDISWSAEARTNIARDKELLKLMARANCDRVFIGFESINPKTLESYNKRQTLDDVKKCINNLHEAGIGIHGMFALGSDDDDLNTITDTVKFCHEMEMKSAQFALLHPLPGSRLYNILDSEDRIFTKDWSLYDGTHVVFKPNRIHPVELQEKFFWAWKTFYSLWHKPHLYLICRYVIKRWKKKNKNRIVELKKKFNDANWKPNFSNND